MGTPPLSQHPSGVPVLSGLHFSSPLTIPHILPGRLGVPPVSLGVEVPHQRLAGALVVGRRKLHVLPRCHFDSTPLCRPLTIFYTKGFSKNKATMEVEELFSYEEITGLQKTRERWV